MTTADARQPMTCREFVELVTGLIEGHLSDADRAVAERHLGGCKGCVVYLEQMRATITALRGVAAGNDFARTREQALAAFRDLRAD